MWRENISKGLVWVVCYLLGVGDREASLGVRIVQLLGEVTYISDT